MYVYTRMLTPVYIYTSLGLTFSSASINSRIARADASRAHPGSDSKEGGVAVSSGTDHEGASRCISPPLSISLSLAVGEGGDEAFAPSLALRKRRERGEGDRHGGDGGGEEELWRVWTGERRSDGRGGGGGGVL